MRKNASMKMPLSQLSRKIMKKENRIYIAASLFVRTCFNVKKRHEYLRVYHETRDTKAQTLIAWAAKRRINSKVGWMNN